MENLLYYPYINLPKSDWSYRLLLYYDTISSIVPQEYFYSPENNYDAYMLELVQNELVIPINPMRVLNHPWEISEPLLEYFETVEFIRRVRRFRGGNPMRNIIHRFSYKIHSDKFDERIFFELERKELSVRAEGRWFLVPFFIANILMAYLTSVISQKLELQPASDVRIRPYFQWHRNNYNPEMDMKREIILKSLIPFPKEIDLYKLRRFKDKYLDLLKIFKNKIELFVLDERYIEGSQIFNEKIAELLFQKDELSRKMKENQFKDIFFGTVCGILGGFIGFATASTSGATILGIPGLLNAIHSALKIENPNRILDQTGMKYLSLIDKQLK